MPTISVDVKEGDRVIVLPKEDAAALQELLDIFAAPSTILRSLSNRYALLKHDTVERISTMGKRTFGDANGRN